MVSDGEEGKDRGSALRGSFERPKAGAGHENKAGKMVEMRKQHGGKVRAQTVGVVDERSEIAACYQGIPQNDVGCRTDVLDACPKAEGMMMLIRSMAPEVVAVDEIGGENDLEALRYVMNCGCRILATVHGNSMEDIREKPGLSSFCKKNGLSGMWCWEIDADRERWRRYMMQLARSSYVDKIAWNLPCMCIVCGDWRG